MSTIAGPITVAESPRPEAGGPAPAPAPSRTAGAWLRVALACGILAAAGAVRAWQGQQIAGFMERGRACPFPLDDLPRTVGPWTTTEEQVLDPAIQRGAAATESVSRTYVDDRTGVGVGLLVLYGPALGMNLHSPARCYPAAGYALDGDPVRRDLSYTRRDGTQGHAAVAALTFTRGEGPAAERKQVYYAWGHDGRWSPDLMSPKAYQRVPGMFKVHLERRSAAGEAIDADNPCESLLRSLLPEIDARLANRGQSQARAKAPAPAAGTPAPAAAR